jgi:hypothetical protein
MVSLIDLLTFIFVIDVPFLTGFFVAKDFGIWTGTGAGILSATVCVTAVVLSYRKRWQRARQRQKELSEKYRMIYRVVAVPTDANSILKAEGAEIKIGDYGWEAEPMHKDNLIYLQGLTNEWKVVWCAGFRPDQIENAGLKPRSQYFLPYSYMGPKKSRVHPCPYPVQTQQAVTLGFPNFVHLRFKRKSAG